MGVVTWMTCQQAVTDTRDEAAFSAEGSGWATHLRAPLAICHIKSDTDLLARVDLYVTW